MDSIVEHGLKIDLHIHSCASAPKDGSKVKNNTVENIPLLVSKLYKDIIFDTKPIARKVYKNSENRTFLAVFAVFVVIRLAPSDPTRSVADTVDVAPVRLAQGIIK